MGKDYKIMFMDLISAALCAGGSGGGGGQTFERPSQWTLEPVTGYPFNFLLTETYESGDIRKVGMYISSYGSPYESISALYFYDSAEVPPNPYNYDGYISFSNFYIG